MVSTRGIKYKFCDGEKVLCYEPDPTKARVLYDSKVLEVVETKNKRGRRLVEYLIHFQGWNRSWDRRVSEDFVLKDTEENRQLQRDLADKSQLQLGAYLYRKDRQKRMRKSSGGGFSGGSGSSSNNADSKLLRHRGGSSEDGSSCGTSGYRDDADYNQMEDGDTESYSSSVESCSDEDRVYIQISERLKQYLDYDYNMITKNNKLINLPAKIPVVTILENYVKNYSIKLICGLSKYDSNIININNNVNSGNSNSNNTSVNKDNINNLKQSKPQRYIKIDKKLLNNYKEINNLINLCKEIVDGIRLYFDFTLKNYLLYKQEIEQANFLLSEENLKNFTYITSEQISLDLLKFKQETPTTPVGSELSESQASCSDSTTPTISTTTTTTTPTADDCTRRRLRSYKAEENEFIFDINATTTLPGSSTITTGSTSSGGSTPQASNLNVLPITTLNLLKTILPLNIGLTKQSKEILDNILLWKLLPTDAPPEPSMIYGATHLARLIVKLPEFLSATSMTDDRLKILFKNLDSFIEFFESHKEWFGEHNYKDTQPVTSQETSATLANNIASPKPTEYPSISTSSTVDTNNYFGLEDFKNDKNDDAALFNLQTTNINVN